MERSGQRERKEENIICTGKERVKIGQKGLLTKVMNGGIPRLAKFVSIFMIKIILMFFNFKRFSNDARCVIRGRG